MKKQLLSLALLSAAWLAGGSALAQFDVSKVYTIESNNNAGKYMQDNGDGYIVTGALNANSYWEFEATGNDGCYYVKNAKTGKYMQQTSEYEVSVKTGDTFVEIYIKNDPAKGTTVYGMASTDRNPHDFASDDTYGANYNSGTGVVQGFSAALGARPNSFWKIIGHSFTNGVCSDNCTEKYQAPALNNDGWYELTNAGNVEWLSNAVANGGGAEFKAKLMNDIDFLSIENIHNPIGPSTGAKFKGEFDGQGHRILNMIINRTDKERQGFFGWLQGNSSTYVHDMIIDSSCSIKARANSAALAGGLQNNGGQIRIENIVNEAEVWTSGQNPAGFLSNQDGNAPKVILRNCVNKGHIHSADQYPWAGAFASYLTNTENVFENIVNIGLVEGADGGSLGRLGGTDENKTNLVDLSNSNNKTGGIVSELTAADVESGKLAWYLNHNDKQDYDAFYQTIGTDNYPMPFNTHGIVNYISAASYTTQYIPSTDVTIPTGVKAYAGVISGDNLSLKEITGAISKDDAVILQGSEGYYSFIPTTGASKYTGNVLKGSDGSVTGGDNIYALAKPEGQEVGFYPVASTVTIPAGKAYLVDGSLVKGFTFVFDDDATGIKDFKDLKDSNVIYNVAGQRLNKMQKGINIVNGKKVMVK